MTLPLAALLQGAVAGGPTGQTYVDDVFSTYLYTGNGSTQTITNGIDLAGKGGLVWIKKRGVGIGDHHLYDTVRGATNMISSNTTGGTIVRSTGLTAFNSNGFSIGAYSEINGSGDMQVSWTFRKAPKFFDMVTFTTASDGSITFNHSLGSAPGMVVIKRTDGVNHWWVFHRSLTSSNYYLKLNETAAETNFGSSWITTSASSVTTSAGFLNNSSAHVAYLFAHDTSTDGIIQCGSFTTDGSGNATVNLGWEPQYILWKASSTTGQWYVEDVMRGLGVTNTNSATLIPNISNAEGAGNGSLQINSTGFGVKPGNSVASQTYIYLAIRRPNKPPTLGTQVYDGTVSSAATGTPLTTGFPVDMQFLFDRSDVFGRTTVVDRLRGASSTSTTLALNLITSSSVAEANTYNATRNWNNTGFEMPNSFGGESMVFHSFRRAPGVFDEVCYTGTGVAKTEAHNLGVAPELWIIKGRSGATAWRVGCTALANTDYLVLDSTAASATDATSWDSTYPTVSVFSLGTQSAVNTSSATYAAYLFATKAGISKVFSFTGNGTNQNIECGFTTGARFVLLKRTDSAGNWLVADTARGIVAGNDPSLALNSTAAEVTTVDWIDPYSGGFNVVQESTNNVNVNNATYIGIAFA